MAIRHGSGCFVFIWVRINLLKQTLKHTKLALFLCSSKQNPTVFIIIMLALIVTVHQM